MVISIASVAGCNLGDFVSLYLGLGHWLGLFPLLVGLAFLLYAERRSRRAGEGWYWAAILLVRTAATNAADLLTHTPFWLPHSWVIASLEALQVLVDLPVAAQAVAAGPRLAALPIANGWYWAAMLTAGSLGTAIGDCVAEQFGWGTGFGTLALGLAAAVVLGAGAKSHWSTKASYWLAVVAVRAAGTTAGDFLAGSDHGLGLPVATALSCGMLAAIIALWRPRAGAPSARPADDESRIPFPTN